jgi:hypothetical protein
MKILIACEVSQVVTIEFRKLGFNAFSCDTQETDGNHPEWHIKKDVLSILDDEWVAMIAFPPCKYLANPGLHYLKTRPERLIKHKRAVMFFMSLVWSDIGHVAIENPPGWMNTNYRKRDQIIQPYYFGTPELKTTCLWLRGLPVLEYQKPKLNAQNRGAA